MMMMMGLACCCCCCILLCSGGGAGAYALRDDLGLTDFFDDIVGTSTTSSDVTNAPGVTSAPGSLAAASKDPAAANTPTIEVKDSAGNSTGIEFGETSGLGYSFTGMGDKGGAGGASSSKGIYTKFNALGKVAGNDEIYVNQSKNGSKMTFVRNPADASNKTFRVFVDNHKYLATGDGTKAARNECNYAEMYEIGTTANNIANRFVWSLVKDTEYANTYRLHNTHCNKELLALSHNDAKMVPAGAGTRFIITAM